MPRRIDQVQVVLAAVGRRVFERCRLRLDRDATLALEIHRIEHLCFHFPVTQAAAALNQAVGQGRLAVIDMRDDREVADVLH